jgi:hypothetical protein
MSIYSDVSLIEKWLKVREKHYKMTCKSQSVRLEFIEVYQKIQFIWYIVNGV